MNLSHPLTKSLFLLPINKSETWLTSSLQYFLHVPALLFFQHFWLPRNRKREEKKTGFLPFFHQNAWLINYSLYFACLGTQKFLKKFRCDTSFLDFFQLSQYWFTYLLAIKDGLDIHLMKWVEFGPSFKTEAAKASSHWQANYSFGWKVF